MADFQELYSTPETSSEGPTADNASDLFTGISNKFNDQNSFWNNYYTNTEGGQVQLKDPEAAASAGYSTSAPWYTGDNPSAPDLTASQRRGGFNPISQSPVTDEFLSLIKAPSREAFYSALFDDPTKPHGSMWTSPDNEQYWLGNSPGYSSQLAKQLQPAGDNSGGFGNLVKGFWNLPTTQMVFQGVTGGMSGNGTIAPGLSAFNEENASTRSPMDASRNGSSAVSDALGKASQLYGLYNAGSSAYDWASGPSDFYKNTAADGQMPTTGTGATNMADFDWANPDTWQSDIGGFVGADGGGDFVPGDAYLPGTYGSGDANLPGALGPTGAPGDAYLPGTLGPSGSGPGFGIPGVGVGTGQPGGISPDEEGLRRMGMDAGLSGAKLDSFVASGGTQGATAFGGGGVGTGAASPVGSPATGGGKSAGQPDLDEEKKRRLAQQTGKAAAAPAQGGVGGYAQKAVDAILKNPLGAGSLALNAFSQYQKNKNNQSAQDQLREQARPANEASKQLIAQGLAGQVPAGILQQFNKTFDQQKSAIESRYANMGRDPMNDSSAQAEIKAIADQRDAQIANYASTLLNQGLNAAGVANGPAVAAVNAGVAQDKELSNAMSNAMQQYALLQAQQAAKTTPATP